MLRTQFVLEGSDHMESQPIEINLPANLCIVFLSDTSITSVVESNYEAYGCRSYSVTNGL